MNIYLEPTMYTTIIIKEFSSPLPSSKFEFIKYLFYTRHWAKHRDTDMKKERQSLPHKKFKSN